MDDILRFITTLKLGHRHGIGRPGRSIACIVAAIAMCIARPVVGHGTSCKLALVNAKPLQVDPSCNTCDGGDVELLLRNDNANVVHLLLGVTDLVSVDTKKPVWAVPMIHASDPLAHTHAELADVAAGKFVRVVVHFSKLAEEGEWEGRLNNFGTDLGPFRVLRRHLPFNVTLENPDPAHPEVHVRMGTPITFSLKNADATNYATSWTLNINGLPSPAAEATLAAGSPNNVTLNPRGEWIDKSTFGYFEYLLKDPTVDGQLLARLSGCPTPGCNPIKSFPLKAHLSYFSPTARAWLGAIVTVVPLIVGALVSLFLNAFIPNQTRRNELKRALVGLDGAIRVLPRDLASRLRVLVAVERRRLHEALAATRAIDTEFASVATEVAAGTERLRQRVELLQQLGQLRTSFEALSSDVLAPTLLWRLDSRFDDVVAVLNQVQFTDADISTVQGDLKSIQSGLGELESLRSGSALDSARVTEVQHRLAALRSVLEPPADDTPDAYAPFRATLTPFFDRLDRDLSNLQAPDYPDEDVFVYKLELIRDFVEAEALLQRSVDSTQLDAQRRRFLKDLQHASWGSLTWARRHVNEMKDGLFKEDIHRALLGSGSMVSEAAEGSVRERNPPLHSWIGRASHRMDGDVKRDDPQASYWQTAGVQVDTASIQLRPFQGIQLKIRFVDEALDQAAAKAEFVPVWNFNHDGLQPERGWDVMHYFPVARKYTIRVAFEDRSQNDRPYSDQQHVYLVQDVDVQTEYDRRRFVSPTVLLGGVRFAVALIPVMLALYAGASEQLAKLDVIPGLVAVFLLGFSSDQVKNLLSK